MIPASEAAPLRVAIDARMPGDLLGGVTQVVMGLAVGLGGLVDGDERYLFVANPGESEWLEPYLGRNSQLLFVTPRRASGRPRRLAAMRLAIGKLAPSWFHRLSLHAERSDGTLESAGVDVVHFTHQAACITSIPSIYNPHDLQHLHLPGNFTRRERVARESIWTQYARQAACIGVTSSWIRDDILRCWAIPSERVKVIPWAPVISHYPDPDAEYIQETRCIMGLPNDFALYPAQTWPHKNHLRLAKAIAELRRRGGPSIPVICTGGRTRHLDGLLQEIKALGVADLFRFEGFVPPKRLRALYSASRAVVVPSLFEAASFPVWEAFEVGVPVACARTTSLPVQVGDAAVLFDPLDEEDIAASLKRVWLDESLRRELVQRGLARVSMFTWERTARAYRALYRQVGGRMLSREDSALLTEAPLL